MDRAFNRRLMWLAGLAAALTMGALTACDEEITDPPQPDLRLDASVDLARDLGLDRESGGPDLRRDLAGDLPRDLKQDLPPADLPRDLPLADQPVHDLPPADLPQGDLPVTDMPLADMPVGDLPVTDMPLTDMPLHDMPLHDMPVGDLPVTDLPLTDQSLVDSSTPTDLPLPDGLTDTGPDSVIYTSTWHPGNPRQIDQGWRLAPTKPAKPPL